MFTGARMVRKNHARAVFLHCFFDEIAFTDKSLHIYAGLIREIFNECAKDRVIHTVGTYLFVFIQNTKRYVPTV